MVVGGLKCVSWEAICPIVVLNKYDANVLLPSAIHQSKFDNESILSPLVCVFVTVLLVKYLLLCNL